MIDPEKSCARSRQSYMKNQEKMLTVQQEEVKVTGTIWGRVTMIVLNGAVNIGIGTGGPREPLPAQYYAMY